MQPDLRASEEGLASILKNLTSEFDTLVFWKHLDRGLAGSGDIDSIAPPEVALQVCERFSQLAAETWPDVELIFRCRHAPGVYPVFIVRKNDFPSLVQFDVSFRPSRMGLPWLNPNSLAEFSMLSDHGIRVLYPGALAIVLAFLYGIQRSGRTKMKTHDLSDIRHGLRHDPETAARFVDRVLPAALRSNFHRLIAEPPQTLDGSQDNFGAWSQSTWKVCLITAARYQAAKFGSRLPAILIERYLGNCDVRKIVHQHERSVPGLDQESFLAQMVRSENVLYQRDPKP